MKMLVYYDVTYYYFKTNTQDDFKRKDISKEHCPNPISKADIRNPLWLLAHELFPGNTNDSLTYRPNFSRIKKEFELGRLITIRTLREIKKI